VADNRGSAVFGKRREPHTVIIARGEEIRHFTIRPWMAAAIGSALCAVTIGYLLATTYLVFRDDLMGATVARQARMQQAYEDRIAALRAQVDRITSRQLLDQQLMENKVTELLQRQAQLSQRHWLIEPMLEDSDKPAPAAKAEVPLPQTRPDKRADATALPGKSDIKEVAHALWATRDSHSPFETAADRADRLFVAINQSLRSIESQQIEKVTTLAENAFETADAITEALQSAGLEVDADYGERDVGGPLIAIDQAAIFDTRVKDLDFALNKLDSVKAVARRLPIFNPAPGRPVTSGFGVRKDPLIGAAALHAGMDFRSTVGSSVIATGAGKVVKAGWNGGYGRMVEVDHGGGYTTRYAHMSKILVEVGQEVKVGDQLGLSGSSGRSTGPHLHYEVRKDGQPLNPLRFIKAGREVSKLM
jgi:murein DD-endopeptidase MepM/ murein hydrolase activator NlpD